jgi:hypothetical protein
MANLSTCVKPTCAVTLEGKVTTCPKCGGPMRMVAESRVRGWILLIIGLSLVLFMGAITLSMAPMLLQPGKDMGGGGSFSGTADDARMILALFGVVIAFGLTSASYGAYQLIFRRESKVFIVLTMLLAIVLVLACVFLVRGLE